MKKSIYILILSFLALKSFSQSAEIRPNQGISVPQFTTVFINAMTPQPKGTVVFDKDINTMKYWTGTVWQSIGAGASSLGWTASGTNILNSNTGNVGIGVAVPLAKVDIGTTTPSATGLQSITSGASSKAIYGQAANGGFGVVGESFGPNAIGGYFISDGTTGTALKAETINSGNAAYLSAPGGGYALIVNQGNVGINFPNPMSTLAVKKNTNIITPDGSLALIGTSHVSHFHYGTNEDTYVRGGKNGSAVVINDGALGNVGIGVYPSTYKLEVNGTMRAKEVIVETGWADYVFAPNYKLPSIYDMEKYINANQHLQNVPSASEIENKGLKVGETNKAMMEKIEELALYIIQLKKEIDVLNAKN
jgi:hypothetical protein